MTLTRRHAIEPALKLEKILQKGSINCCVLINGQEQEQGGVSPGTFMRYEEVHLSYFSGIFQAVLCHKHFIYRRTSLQK